MLGTKMNAYSVLDPTLQVILDGIKPSRQDWEIRFKILGDLQDIVKSIENLRGATVEPFGSFVSNLFTRWGDLDISILLANGAYISSSGKKRKQNLLEEVLRALREKGGWHRLKFISSARVPILKFESGYRGISCDVSIDNMEGVMKSKFLFWLSEIDKRFRDMVVLVKEWAKAHNINNPKAGSLNSYSLSLLVIFHFQTCVPPILPPLKDIYPTNAADDLTGVRADAERSIKEICTANIARYRSDRSRAVNRSSLSELFISFLAKFADVSLRATDLGICPFTGKWEEIRGNMRWMPRTYAIFIEDPFEQPQNTARGVSATNLQRISEAFQRTHQSLVSPNLNQISLLGMLVRPQISRLILGTPAMVPINGYGHHQITTYPQTSMDAVYAQQQAHHQIRMQRKDSRPVRAINQKQGSNSSNSTMQRPGSRIIYSTKQKQGHSSNSMKQKEEGHPSNSMSNSMKQKEEGHPSNSMKQRPPGQPQNVQGQQQIWRAKPSQ